MDRHALLVPAHQAPVIDDWCAQHEALYVDLGTGDAAFALRLARQQPEVGVIGVDTCLAQVRVNRRRQPANLALLRCDAAALPPALDDQIRRLTVNFPFGSLLTGLLDGEERLIARLGSVLASDGAIEVRVNDSALTATGASLHSASDALRDACHRLGCGTIHTRHLDAAALRRFPTSWAKRAGSGRDAIEVIGRGPGGNLARRWPQSVIGGDR